MKSILRATAVLGSSSIVGILVGLVSAKFSAVLLGPNGVGLIGLLQSLVGLSGLIAGMGIGVGLIRAGAFALAEEDYVHFAALRSGAWLIVGVLGTLALAFIYLFRVPISQWILGTPELEGSVALMGVVLVFNLASGLQVSILNAYHRVGVLAKIGILNSVLGTSATLSLIWLWREQGIAPAMIASAAVSWAISYSFLKRNPGIVQRQPTRKAVFDAAWSLLRFGAPYTVSMLVGTGVQMMLSIVVLHSLDTANVGFYRAAVAVSGTYLGFLLSAMAQDYYPRISAVGGQPLVLVDLVNQQHRLVMMLGIPMILGTLALAPYLVPLVYSPQFYPAVDVLEWQLIADILKFSSWTMSFVILAHSGSVVFFLVELIGGVTTLLTSWVGLSLFGLEGIGISFLATYMVYYLVVWGIVRREIPLVWTNENKLMLLAALLAALVIRLLPFLGLQPLRLPVALSLALLAGAGSAYAIWKEVGGLKSVQARIG